MIDIDTMPSTEVIKNYSKPVCLCITHGLLTKVTKLVNVATVIQQSHIDLH